MEEADELGGEGEEDNSPEFIWGAEGNIRLLSLKIFFSLKRRSFSVISIYHQSVLELSE